MPLEHRVGDLFAQPGLPALAHGVNCRGVMGAGIARTFRARDEAMFTHYRDQCRQGGLRLGGCLTWVGPGGVVVYNLATQDRPGPHADLGAVALAVTSMLTHAADHGITAVGLPRIGAGIGGLLWPEVRDTLQWAAAPSPVTLVVVSQPGASID